MVVRSSGGPGKKELCYSPVTVNVSLKLEVCKAETLRIVGICEDNKENQVLMEAAANRGDVL